jgi:Fe-S-cluster-containing hydrogenase component 2
MACSYHHKGVFSPSISSIKILDTRGGLGFAISLAEQDEDNGTIACDGCEGLDEPLCVKYCTEKEELLGILEDFQRGFGHNKSQ